VTTRRRLTSLAIAAAVLAVGACGASQGETAAQTETVGRDGGGALDGIGETPEQFDEGETALPTAPPPTASLPEINVVVEDVVRPDITDDRVFMVGDSVLEAMAIGDPDPIDAYVGALGWDVTVDAVTGRFTDEGLSVLRKRKDEVHQVLVAMLGNNYGGNELQYADQVTQMLEMFPDVRMVVMFTVPLYEKKQAEVNDVLRTLAAKDRRLVLIDWEAASRAYEGSLRPDDVHPSEFGTDLLAQMVGVVLGRSPDAEPTVTLPIVGSSERPKVAAGTDTNKGEGNSTPRPGGNSNDGAAPTTKAPAAPVTTKPQTATTRTGTLPPIGPGVSTSRPGVPTSTTKPSGPTTTGSPGGSTSIPSGTTAPPPATTSPQATNPPATNAPTNPPATNPPATDPPATNAPTNPPPAAT
jgi:hypothetical protein